MNQIKSKGPRRSKYRPADALTALILEIFRLNGRLLQSGDQLVGELGLTSARWQVIGAIALSQSPQPVAHIARDMGLSRQAVQRIVNELVKADVVEFRPNPHHRTARLIALTKRGETIFEQAEALQKPWAKKLARALDVDEIEETTSLLKSLRSKLGTSNN